MSVFGGIKDMHAWVLVLICCSILLVSFIERVDVILCDVNSASLFASSLAFCVMQFDLLPWESHGRKFSDSTCDHRGNWLSNLQISRDNPLLDAPCYEDEMVSVA